MNTQMKTLMSQRIFNSNTCRILFATCLSALCLAALSTQAATITVINTADSEFGSLRQALADANDGDTIDFGITGTITLFTGQLVVDKSVTINGPGAANLAVDGNGASRVFYIGSGRTVTIDSLTIINGNAGSGDTGGGIYNDQATLTVTNCTLSGNSAGYRGGGIFNGGEFGSATLTISHSTLSGNSSTSGAGYGGGIFNAGGFGSATLTITNSTLSGNSARSGGGIYNNGAAQGSAPLTITNSTLSGNSASGWGGGGIYNDQATLTITNSTLSGNSTQSYGGGIINAGDYSSATLTISNSTLSGNSAGVGGGIYNNVASQGSATLTMTNSTLSGNSANSYAGGIYNGGVFGHVDSTRLRIGSTVLKAGTSGANIENAYGTVTSLGYNLSNDFGSDVLTATGDQVNTDPLLGQLQYNGGSTSTHKLLSGSPAIDAGGPNFTPPPDYDQRGPGFARVVNGRIDIGAFEVRATSVRPRPGSTITTTEP